MKSRSLARILAMSGLIWSAGTAGAQAPIAHDDSYEAAAGYSLLVEAVGVLANDTDALGEDLAPSASAELVGDVSNGTLDLASDGSFTYVPAVGFLGIDTFSYRVLDGALVSNVATVTLSVRGCSGALPLLTCWVESEYVAELLALGYDSFQESFEEAAVWPLSPDGAGVVTSLGTTWSSNHAGSELRTGPGAAHTGARGLFSIPHGNTTGAPLDPQRDGFTGTAAGTFVGVGGWLTSNTPGARVQFLLTSPPDPPVVVDFVDPVVSSAHKFFGVIDTRGFSSFEVVETEGVVEDQKLIFGDDFGFAVIGAPACGNGMDDDGDGWADFPIDPGCLDATGVREDPQCQDGADNDGANGIDFDGGQSIWGACTGEPGGCPPGVSDPEADGVANPDPQCVGQPWANREARSGRRCGLGYELAALLPLLVWLRRTRGQWNP